jgi:hypothetical protein
MKYNVLITTVYSLRYNKTMSDCLSCKKRNSPIDLFNKKNYVDMDIRDARFNICLGCDRLYKRTKTCKECGCFMNRKTWLKDASCPLGKWNSE